MNYNVNNENERIIIGEVGENLAESCTIDYSAWVEEYGEGNLRIRAIREGDAEPYPVASVETADGVATWTYTAADTAVKGFGEVQVLYYVGDVLAKSRVWKTYTYRSLSTSSETVPDPYQDWLESVEAIGNQVEADAEAASASADSASASATLAAGSASEAAESALSASRSASAALGSASAASTSAESAASSASAASRSATEASNYEYYSEQYMNEAKAAKFGAESARTGAENAKAAAQASSTAAAQSAEQAQETAESIEESADTIQKLLDNQIHDTATGTIASFPDGADMPMVSLVADIDPIQDTSGGAPSPSNICPISGWDSVDVSVSGVNVWDEEWEVGGLNPNTGEKNSVTDRIRSKNFIPVVPNQTYYFCNGTNNAVVYEYDADKNYLNKYVYKNPNQPIETMLPDCHYIMFYMVSAYGTTYNNDISINYPSTDHDYHAYDGNTYTTTLPQTVYGGTLDVVSGVLTVDRAMIEPTSVVRVAQSAGLYYFVVRVSGGKNGATAISNRFEAYVAVRAGACYVTGDGLVLVFTLADQTITTIEQANQWLADNPTQFCYELATPTTIQLTPTQIDSLLGRNNVWADSGDVTVEYIADTKLYIQKVIS